MTAVLHSNRRFPSSTANFISPDRAFEIVKELPAVCRQLGVTSLDELRGSLKTA